MITATATIARIANAMTSGDVRRLTGSAPTPPGRGDDAGEDDEADAVADAALGDELAEPHQGDRAGGQRGDLGQRLEVARSKPVDRTPCEFSRARKPYAWSSAIGTVR